MIRYLLLLLGVLASDVAEARTKGMGAGVILGEPIAGTLLYRWSDRQAVQFMTGWSFGQKRLHLGGDYLFIPNRPFRFPTRPCAALGIGMGDWDLEWGVGTRTGPAARPGPLPRAGLLGSRCGSSSSSDGGGHDRRT